MDGGIKIKKLNTLLVAIFILALISSLGAATEIIVQPGDSIQTAVNSSSSGDIITINPGTYIENIIVTKNDLTIRSKSGNPDNTMIKAKSSGANVFLLQGDNIKISGLKAVGATRSGYSGICLSSCSNCVIENNKLLSNCYGIYLLRSKGDKLSKNTATNNLQYGIVLGTATDNTISGNTALNNGRGIHIGNSDGNTLSGNTVQNNNIYGFYICGKSDTNKIYNNYFNDTNMTIKNGIGNSYNTKKTAGTNIVGGPYIGGNFWGKPNGTGFSNTAVDNDRDGISDSAYKNIAGSIYSDNLPLVVYKPKSTKPVAAFSASPTSEKAPLNVKFTDKSTGSPTFWYWNFGDGSKSYLQNPTHKYSKAGAYNVSLIVKNAAGRSTVTKTGYIKVISKPVAAFSGSPTSGKAPLNVKFTDKSTGIPASWYWNFGDGSKSYLQNPVHKYSKAGTYTVSLIAKNAAGRSTVTKTGYIKVTGTSQTSTAALFASSTPTAALSASPTSGKTPLTVDFTDNSTGSPTSWKWDFGDGTYSTEQSPTHTYSAAGTYTVKLTATNTAGSNTVTKPDYITVTATSQTLTETSQTPVADFWASQLSGKAPLNVTFTDTSTGSPTSWEWDFGDGTYSTEQSPTHTYSAAGTYTVKLTATNAAGNNTKTKSNYITVTGASQTLTETSQALTATSQTPIADFWASQLSGNTPLDTTFTDTSTGSPTSWKWDFGDGISSTEQSPTHTYSAAGTYTVKLTATNEAGNSTKTKSNYITVTGTSQTLPETSQTLTETSQTPVADFWASQLSGKAPLDATFTDTSTGSPTSWEWDFGDGTYSTEQSPTHTYSDAGTYTVKLTATNEAGNSTKTKSNYITVTGTSQTLTETSQTLTETSQMPVADFWASQLSGNAPLDATFTDTSTGSPTSWEWDFGDGTYSTEQSPTHTYSAAGTYTVKLTATNEAGNSTKTKSNYITVTGASQTLTETSQTLTETSQTLTETSQMPVADFWASPLSGAAPLDATFTDTSTGSPTSWEWDFGDGTSSTEQNPTHTYSAAGTYMVKLTATNAAGSDTKTKSNYIKVAK